MQTATSLTDGVIFSSTTTIILYVHRFSGMSVAAPDKSNRSALQGTNYCRAAVAMRGE